MSNEMITAAIRFAKGKKTTFPIMTIKQLGEFIERVRTERLTLNH